MVRFTLHVPETLNDGSPVRSDTFAAIEHRLLTIGGGFTLTHGIGAWRGDDGTTYREHIRLYHVDAEPTLETDASLRTLAALVAEILQQEAVYLTATTLTADLVRATEVAA